MAEEPEGRPERVDADVVPEQEGEVGPEVVRQTTAVRYSRRAPIPDAAELEHYEKVLPGAADRIVTMAENRAAHLERIQSKSLDMTGRLADNLMRLGTVVVLAGLAAASYLVYEGHDVTGAVTAIADLLIAALGAVLRRPRKEAVPDLPASD